MSNALALSAVTATVQFWLNSALNDPSSPLGSVAVSAKAPDLVQAGLNSGNGAELAVNLFLHQVTPNAAWRNMALPSVSKDGKSRLTNQALALDLHYLLTAYGTKDTEAEALLGYAVLMLHETPALPREQIKTALGALPATNPYAGVLKTSGIADQIEMIKITPATLGREEMAWLWTALKADYRPTFPFQISVVLIEPQFPTMFALPVLSRKLAIQAGMPPQIESVDPPPHQAAPAPGDTVTIRGSTLNLVTRISLAGGHPGVDYPAFVPATVTSTVITFPVPNDPTKLPAGIYQVTALVTDAAGTVQESSNSMALAIAPRILNPPLPAAVANPAGTLVSLSCAPDVLPTQSVSLIMGGTAAPAVPFTAVTSALTFQFPTLAPGPYLARLNVDGVVSPISVNWIANPPVFTGPMVNV
ncbi:MAG TPA: DUF4255 domain-containing protein [Acidisarcina sp.]